jgi:hypothetical protein
MPVLRLSATAAPQKYGWVIVRNVDGSINREYRITAAEYAALARKGAGAPPGVTDEEWSTGRAIAASKDYDVGDMDIRDGVLRMKVAETVVNGQTIETFVRAGPGEFTGTPPNVTIAPSVLAAIDQSRSPVIIESVDRGQVRWRSR